MFNRRVGIAPTGGCSPYETHADCGGFGCRWCTLGAVKKAEPCPGHATPEEARRHNRDHEVASATFDARMSPPGVCGVCQQPAEIIVSTHSCGEYYFCDEHATREHLDALAPELCSVRVLASW